MQTHKQKLEEGRAITAFEFAKFGVLISSSVMQMDNIFYKDDKYSSYVKKIPMYIKTNGLRSTLAFIKSKGAKEKDKKMPGSQENPRNAYDLIYSQVKNWLVKKGYLNSNVELVEYIVSLNSTEYRKITEEVLALLNWLCRFADGLDTKGE